MRRTFCRVVVLAAALCLGCAQPYTPPITDEPVPAVGPAVQPAPAVTPSGHSATAVTPSAQAATPVTGSADAAVAPESATQTSATATKPPRKMSPSEAKDREGIPADLPIPEQVQVFDHNHRVDGYRVVMGAVSPSDAVATFAFFQEELPKHDWSVGEVQENVLKLQDLLIKKQQLLIEKEGRVGTVSIGGTIGNEFHLIEIDQPKIRSQFFPDVPFPEDGRIRHVDTLNGPPFGCDIVVPSSRKEAVIAFYKEGLTKEGWVWKEDRPLDRDKDAQFILNVKKKKRRGAILFSTGRDHFSIFVRVEGP